MLAEAFLTYYDRLSERGIVSFSRWYFIKDPAETLRLVALGLDGWRRSGVSDPASHIIVVANLAKNRSATEGLATMLLKKTPFTLRWVIPGLIGGIGLYLLLLPAVITGTQQLVLPARIVVSIVVILPVGFLMGQPFPLGIKQVHLQAPRMIPWLWAVNGAASVVGSALATLVALRAGFRIVSLAGMCTDFPGAATPPSLRSIYSLYS